MEQAKTSNKKRIKESIWTSQKMEKREKMVAKDQGLKVLNEGMKTMDPTRMGFKNPQVSSQLMVIRLKWYITN